MFHSLALVSGLKCVYLALVTGPKYVSLAGLCVLCTGLDKAG